MRLKADRVQEYIQVHRKEEIWQSVLAGLRQAGFAKMLILMRGQDAILFEEAEDLKAAYQSGDGDPESARWDRMIAEMMEVYPKFSEVKGDIEFVEIPVVFYYENGRLLH